MTCDGSLKKTPDPFAAPINACLLSGRSLFADSRWP
jgi:hypothetical protein